MVILILGNKLYFITSTVSYFVIQYIFDYRGNDWEYFEIGDESYLVVSTSGTGIRSDHDDQFISTVYRSVSRKTNL